MVQAREGLVDSGLQGDPDPLEEIRIPGCSRAETPWSGYHGSMFSWGLSDGQGQQQKRGWQWLPMRGMCKDVLLRSRLLEKEQGLLRYYGERLRKAKGGTQSKREGGNRKDEEKTQPANLEPQKANQGTAPG